MYDRFCEIKLIPITVTYGDLRQEIQTEGSAVKVFAEISSITRQEFLAAGTLGLKPSLVATIYSFEYNDEKIVEINGKRYSVYRTYNRVEDDKIELYLEEKEGTADEPSTSGNTP